MFDIQVKAEGFNAREAEEWTPGQLLVVTKVEKIYDGPAEGVVILTLAETH